MARWRLAYCWSVMGLPFRERLLEGRAGRPSVPFEDSGPLRHRADPLGGTPKACLPRREFTGITVPSRALLGQSTSHLTTRQRRIALAPALEFCNQSTGRLF